MENFNKVPAVSRLNDGTHYDSLQAMANQSIDFEADVFNFSFPGGGGSFVLGNDGVFHPVPYQSVGIAAARTANNELSFVLVDNAGTTYTYDAREYTTSARRAVDGPTNCSAWYLTRMVSADRSDTIRFVYQEHTLNYSSNYYQSITIPQGPEEGALCNDNAVSVGGFSTSVSYNVITHAQKLREVVFREGRVAVLSQGTRADISSDRRLTALALLRTGSPDTVRQVTLFHSYFNGDLAIASPDAKRAYLRLRLDSVQTSGGGVRLPPHRFAYSPVRLPTRGKGPRDHWGYANAAYTASPAYAADPTLVPRTRVRVPAGTLGRDPDGTLLVGNTTREPNPAFVEAGLLQRIAYPTGGHVVYGYEPHTALVQAMSTPPQTTFYHTAAGTGLFDEADTVVTLVTGNYVGALGGAMEIRRENEPGYSFLRQAGGLVTVTDITNGANNEVFRWNIGNTGPNLSGPNYQPFNYYAPPALPNLQANRTYRVLVRARGQYFETSVNLHWESAAPHLQATSKVQGGVRVKTIRSYTAPNRPAQTRTYSYNTPGTTLTSGYPLSTFAPVYTSEQIARRGIAVEGENGDCNITGCRSLLVGSQPVGELTSGQSVNYTYVTVTDSTGPGQGNGQTVSRYSLEQLRGSIAKPYPAPVDLSWRRGNLVRRWTYKGTAAGTLRLVEQQANDYRDSADVEVVGLRAIHNASYSGCFLANIPGNATSAPYANRVAYEQTHYYGEWHYLVRSRQYRYADDTTRYQLTTTAYTYGNKAHAQPTQVTTTCGGASEMVCKQYAPDYDTAAAASPVARAVREMARRRLHTTPLETRTVRQVADGSWAVVQGTAQLPQQVNRGIEFFKTLAWTAAQPKSVGQFAASRIRTGDLELDAGYREQTVVDRFDDLNRVVQYHPTAGVPVSYLWGTGKDEPLAQVRRATPAQLAFTSFEPGSPGQWQYAAAGVTDGVAFTGKYSYALGAGAVQANGLPAGEYLVAFRWLGTGTVAVNGQAEPLPPSGGWRWCQRRVQVPTPGPVTLTGTGQVDEVRLCPAGASMITYTYDPLVGMTSQTDPAGRTTTYEYDALGRLLRARDEQGRILTQQQYHYARP